MNFETWHTLRKDLSRSDAKGLEARLLSGLATQEDLERIGSESVRALKRSADAMHLRFNCTKALGVDEEKRMTLGDVVSSEKRDRVGDVILARGWDLGQYKANPQVLYAHDDGGGGPLSGGSGALPVGLGTKIRRGKSSAGANALLADTRFHGVELNPKAELVFRMVVAGALPGRSVGFIPTTFSDDDKEREKHGVTGFGELIKGSELLEYSVVPIPANADALQARAFKAAKSVLDEAYHGDEFSAALVREVEKGLILTEDQWAAAHRKTMVSVPDLPDESDEEPEPLRVAVKQAVADALEDRGAIAEADARTVQDCDQRFASDGPAFDFGGITDSTSPINTTGYVQLTGTGTVPVDTANKAVEAMRLAQDEATQQIIEALDALGERFEKALETAGRAPSNPSPDSRSNNPGAFYELVTAEDFASKVVEQLNKDIKG